MKKKIKLPAEVLEQLEARHPQMAKEVRGLMDSQGRIEVQDEVWNRETEDAPQKEAPELPEVVDTGLTVGDLLRILKK